MDVIVQGENYNLSIGFVNCHKDTEILQFEDQCAAHKDQVLPKEDIILLVNENLLIADFLTNDCQN